MLFETLPSRLPCYPGSSHEKWNLGVHVKRICLAFDQTELAQMVTMVAVKNDVMSPYVYNRIGQKQYLV